MNTELRNFEDVVANEFFTVKYVKKDGTIRTLNGRLGVVKHLKNPVGQQYVPPNGCVTMYELNKGYRTLRLNQIISVHSGHSTWTGVTLDDKVVFLEDE